MIQTEEKLNKARKLAASLGVSLTDLRDVVAVLQESQSKSEPISLEEMPSIDNVIKSLVMEGRVSQKECDTIDASVAEQFEVFRSLMTSLQKMILTYKGDQKYSVRQLADQLGMASRHVQKLLKGDGNPTLHTIAEIASLSGKKVRLIFE